MSDVESEAFGPSTPDVDVSRTLAAAADCVRRRQFGVALGLIADCLASNPDDLSLAFARASTLCSWNRYREALTLLLDLERRGLASSEFFMKLGGAYFWTGHLEESQGWVHRAVALKPDDWEAHFSLATVLSAQKKNEGARHAFVRALELNPDDKHCMASLVGCDVELERLVEAEALARRAVEIYPDDAIAWSNLAVVLDHQDRYEEAINAFETAAMLSSREGAEPYNFVNHAVCILRDARTEYGIAFLERHLERTPAVQAHCHYSLALLLAGRMDEGWEQYEFRWVDGPMKASRASFDRPAWNGQDLRGRTILLRSEQGLGDFIQFIRYAPHVKALGARVLLQMPEAMRKIAERCEGIDHIVLPDEPYPPFDFFVDLMSLPRVFGTRVDTIPWDAPYIAADPDRRIGWKKRFETTGQLKVGLVWAGSPTHLRDKFRSIPLAQLEALGRLEEVRLYSLQKGPATAQLRSLPQSLMIEDLSPDLVDFADTAAAISELDLIIGVDTSVVHLAGAMGKPVWVMLPKPVDWRWLEGRHDSPWYGSMRLFRQTQVGDWTDVIANVCIALKQWSHCASDRRVPKSPPPSATASRERLLPRTSLPYQGSRLSFAVRTNVGTMQCLPGEDVVAQSLRYYGEYLQPQLDLLRRVIQPGATVMEIGSGIGAHALFLSKMIGASGHLLLDEPRTRVEGVLRQNLSANSATNMTVLAQSISALGDGARDLSDGQASSSLAQSVDELRLERLHCLKVNECTNALGVLKSAIDTFWRLRPIVFAAANGAILDEMAALMRSCSYRTWKMETALFNPVNFNVRDDDIFGGMTAVALFAVPEEVEMDISVDYCAEIH